MPRTERAQASLDEFRSRCIHESGHAVLAQLLGIKSRRLSVSIYSDTKYGGEHVTRPYFASLLCLLVGSHDLRHITAGRTTALIRMGGNAAQRLDGHMDAVIVEGNAGNDYRMAYFWARLYLRRLHPDLPDNLLRPDVELDRLRDYAYDVLGNHMQAVYDMADVLGSAKLIKGRKLRKTLEGIVGVASGSVDPWRSTPPHMRI